MDQLRLPRNIIPISYEILLTPNLYNWTFRGVEKISVEVVTATNEIRLNSLDTLVTDAKFDGKPAEVHYKGEFEQLILRFDHNLSPGKGILEIEFSGTINEIMKGFYRTFYKTDDDDIVRIAVTQFEPTDARRAFPCWDEPNFKATFQLKLIVPSYNNVLSNMPEESRCFISNHHVKVTFQKTPLMSSYLLAFVIGEFDFIESSWTNNFKIRIFTPKNKAPKGLYALDTCCKIMKFFEDYFNIPYPLPKLDVIAIPDFVHGAMENWGLITCRETSLLVDDKESSEKSKAWVTNVLAHECAHMWFGNLVTIDWWSDLWLNEGFATWISYCAIAHCYQEFDPWLDFVTEQYSVALKYDSLKSSHPIKLNIEKISDIISFFDVISYSKGACLIHMLNDYLTSQKFQEGITRYLNKYKFKNTRNEDLWETLCESSGEPIAEMMDPWIKQTGFPLISVKSIKDDQCNTVAVSLTQRWFSPVESNHSEQHWLVPFTLCSMGDPAKSLDKHMLKRNGEPQIFYLPNPEPDLIKINTGAIGFFHVRYEDDILPSVLSAIVQGKMSPIDRLEFVLNTFSMALSGDIEVAEALNFVQSLSSEKSFIVWNSIIDNLQIIGSLVDEMDSTLTNNFERFISDILDPIFNFLGWDEKAGESHNDKMLRSVVISTLGRAGHSGIVEESFRRFESYCQCNEETLSPDTKGAVYSTVLKHGGHSHLRMMLDLFSETDLNEEKVRILKSLGSAPFDEMEFVHRFTLSDKVRKQDKINVFICSPTSARKRGFLWDFVRANWKEVLTQVIDFSLQCFDGFSTTERYNEIKTFLVDFREDRNLKHTLENININITILQRDGERLKEFFSK